MKYQYAYLITFLAVTLYGCGNTETKNSASSSKKGIGDSVQFSEERIAFLYDSLIGNMPREDITPYINSLQGKDTPAYETPESWKLKEPMAIAMLYDWNEKHNDHKATHQSIPYADAVDFYGEMKELEEITAIKTSMFKRYPDFHQEIIPESIKTVGDDNIERIEFTKEVTMNGKLTTYNSYLEFGGTHGAFFIIGEGDVAE